VGRVGSQKKDRQDITRRRTHEVGLGCYTDARTRAVRLAVVGGCCLFATTPSPAQAWRESIGSVKAQCVPHFGLNRSAMR